MNAGESNSNDHWSRWWAQGHITSFGDALRDNYDGATRGYWNKAFSELPNGKLLDIATGNGALATLAVEYAHKEGRHFDLTATDLAIIKEQTNADSNTTEAWRQQVKFFGETPCESQPFPDGSFDGVLSQFGFEYSDVSATLVEVFRLLRSDGQFFSLSHNSGSALVQTQRRGALVYRTALEQLQLFQLLDRHLSSWGKAKGIRAIEKLSGKPKYAKSGLALEHGLRQFSQQFPNDEIAAKVFCSIDDLRRDALEMSPGRRSTAIQEQISFFQASLARLYDLFEAALDPQAVKRIKQLALDIGYSSAEAQPFLSDGRLAGWALAFTK